MLPGPKYYQFKTICCAFSITVLVFTPSPISNAAEVPEAAKAGWRELEESVQDFQYTAYLTQGNRAREVFCARRGLLMKREAKTKKDGSLEHRADLFNGNGFTLYKPGAAWQVGEILASKDTFTGIAYVTTLSEVSYTIYTNKRLLDVIDEPAYAVTSWEPASSDATKVVMTIESRADDVFRKANVELDPSRLFHVTGITYHGHQGENSIWKTEYELDSELRDAIPSSHCCLTGDVRWTITSASKTPPPESEFTLAYYGLPDFVPSRGPNYWLWISAVGVVIAVAILLTRRKWEKQTYKPSYTHG